MIMLWALPWGAVRMLAYRSEPLDHTSTMRTAATFALTLGTLAFLCLIAFSILLLT